MRPGQKIETYPDGYAEVYEESNRRLARRKGFIPFERLSVGVNRFYQSQTGVDGSRIDALIKVPRNPISCRNDIVVIKGRGEQYRIKRIQDKPERGVFLLELQSVHIEIREVDPQ